MTLQIYVFFIKETYILTEPKTKDKIQKTRQPTFTFLINKTIKKDEPQNKKIQKDLTTANKALQHKLTNIFTLDGNIYSIKMELWYS